MSRSKIIKDIPVSNVEGINVIRVSVRYDDGGYNYFTGEKEARGLKLDVSPLEISDDGWARYTAFSGIKKHVLDMGRFNKKKLENFEPNQNDIDQLVRHVCVKNNIKL